MSSQSGAPKPNQDPSYELGDLELAPMPLRPSLQTPDARAADARLDPDFDDELTTVAKERASLVDNDHGFDEFSRGNDLSELGADNGYDGFGDDHSFELDLPDRDRPAPATSKPPVRASFPNPASGGPPRPSGRPWSGSPRDEERAARELADYGEPHEGLGAPFYTLHVARRWVQLFIARREIERRAGEQAELYEKALRDLGRALLDDQAVTQHEALRERVLLVQTRQGEVQRAEEATEAARAQGEQELLVLKQKTAAIEAELAPFREAERAAEAAQAKIDAELKRKKAKIQRAEIELRALERASMPPPPERVQGIEADRAQQQNEIDTLTAQHAEAGAALGRARRELALRRGTLDTADRQHAQQQQVSQAKSRVHEEAVAKAEHLLSAALCALAEAAEGLGLAHSANEQVDGLRANEKALDQVVDELAKYDRALGLWDHAAVLRGSLMWLAVIAALMVLIRIW